MSCLNIAAPTPEWITKTEIAQASVHNNAALIGTATMQTPKLRFHGEPFHSWYCTRKINSDITFLHFRIVRWLSSHALATCWRHQMEAFSALLALCAGISPVTGEFPAQRPVTRSFDVFFDLGLSKRLSKQSWGWWLETPSHPLWRHSNEKHYSCTYGMVAWAILYQWKSRFIMMPTLSLLVRPQFVPWQHFAVPTVTTKLTTHGFKKTQFTSKLNREKRF